MSRTGACSDGDHAHCSGRLRYGSGSWECGCECHVGQEPRPEGWEREVCADCSHPRAFHGRREGYADKCVGVYNRPPCTCVSFVPSTTPKEATA